MIKILVVDDEYLVRVGIAETINWQEYGFEIVGDAKDSEDAYEKFLLLSPDIIITDIRMGETSGLDLVTYVHNNSPTTKLVILSGYQQFDYAKRAMENGVNTYLLKPVDNDALLQEMIKLKNEINQERETEKHSTKSINLYNFIGDILKNSNGQSDAFHQKCKEYHLSLPKENYWVANFEIDKKKHLSTKEVEELHITTTEIIKQFASDKGIRFLHTSIDKCSFSLIIPAVDQQFIHDFKRYLSAKLNHTITIGVSDMQKDAMCVISAFEQARTAFDYRALAGGDRIISYKDVPKDPPTHIAISNQEIDDIIKYIKKVDYNGAFSLIKSFFAKVFAMKNIDIHNLRNVVSEMTVLIMRSIFIHSEKMVQLFDRIVQPTTEIQNYDTVFEIEAWFSSIINKLYENPNVLLDCSYNPTVQQAIAIIIQEYQKPLTVEYVANEILVNQYHFMHVFKQETGKTFNNYLKDYRISLAIDLIKTGQYMIYEIGPMVGYNDAQYFHRVFKKQTGKTPKKFADSI